MIKLTIEICSPLTPEDRDLLSGVAVMTLAIANHEMAAAAFPAVFPPEEPGDGGAGGPEGAGGAGGPGGAGPDAPGGRFVQ